PRARRAADAPRAVLAGRSRTTRVDPARGDDEETRCALARLHQHLARRDPAPPPVRSDTGDLRRGERRIDLVGPHSGPPLLPVHSLRHGSSSPGFRPAPPRQCASWRAAAPCPPQRRTTERSLKAPTTDATPATIAKPAISPMMAASVAGGESSANTDAPRLNAPRAAVQPQGRPMLL